MYTNMNEHEIRCSVSSQEINTYMYTGSIQVQLNPRWPKQMEFMVVIDNVSRIEVTYLYYFYSGLYHFLIRFDCVCKVGTLYSQNGLIMASTTIIM